VDKSIPTKTGRTAAKPLAKPGVRRKGDHHPERRESGGKGGPVHLPDGIGPRHFL
jgi:hypothetical protein